MSADYWITALKLLPHPEGGYFRETYRSADMVLRQGTDKPSGAVTSIHYLLAHDDFSGFHRIQSDELWYFHKGDPLLVHVLLENGSVSTHELSDQLSGTMSLVVEKNQWFAAELKNKDKDYFALVSCAVAPAFDFAEFEMADKQSLLRAYPQHRSLIERLSRE